MRTVMLVVGILFILFGLLWIGQGLGYVGGSFMTGDIKWAYIGFAVAVIGSYMLMARSSRGRSAP